MTDPKAEGVAGLPEQPKLGHSQWCQKPLSDTESHGWCMNRTPEETHCTCVCHQMRKQRTEATLACRRCGAKLMADGEGGWSCPKRLGREHAVEGGAGLPERLKRFHVSDPVIEADDGELVTADDYDQLYIKLRADLEAAEQRATLWVDRDPRVVTLEGQVAALQAKLEAERAEHADAELSLKRKDTPENREFWNFVERTAAKWRAERPSWSVGYGERETCPQCGVCQPCLAHPPPAADPPVDQQGHTITATQAVAHAGSEWHSLEPKPVSALTALVERWEAEAASYPSSELGDIAGGAVRLCAKELRDVLQPAADRQGPRVQFVATEAELVAAQDAGWHSESEEPEFTAEQAAEMQTVYDKWLAKRSAPLDLWAAHVAFNVVLHKAGAERLPACGGTSCDECQAVRAMLEAK